MKYNKDIIKEKAQYCLNCKTKPCTNGCPLQNNIPDFIKYIKEEKYEEAFLILKETTVFEPICGRVCPHKKQCEGSCVRGIKGESVSIGELEAFIGDYMLEQNKIQQINVKSINKKVAIIGAGPAGLACGYLLSKNGVEVTIYEKHSKAGGLLRHGIPDFRLDKKILDQWLEKFIFNTNINILFNIELGKDIQINELKENYDCIVLAFGSNKSKKMNIPGDNLDFVLGGNELLEYKNMPNFKEKRVAVIGGGNVAIDSARTIKRLGADSVKIIYRRTEEEMPAEDKEIQEAKKEKIDFLFKTNILKIFKDGENGKIECINTKLVHKENENRKVPINIENSNYVIDIDYVIMAIGSTADKYITDKLNVKKDENGYIIVDETFKTSEPQIYAIGDLSGYRQTVAWAARSGFEAAKTIIEKDLK